MLDKRQYERTQANVTVKVAVLDLNDNRLLDVEGVLVDASFRGCQLALPPLDVGMVERLTRGDLVLEVATQNALKVLGQVRWHNEHPQGARLGIEYASEVPAQVQLVEQLKRASDGGQSWPRSAVVVAVVLAALALGALLLR